ncbi:MAG: undecaprenyldiphospho-muramoylpentapeptide beta-N-acetylglucosaminyltransferase [Gammaproteobacteria bacterium]|nr:undecaprenyldiphospho-muramoylpentapeptide beta-N-acetylglucosaminyltransferase [Gammaproteobacteria bacterium]
MAIVSLQKVLIMAGGTGGHIFPGIALANAFKAKNIGVFWLGNQSSMESNLVPQHNIPFYSISINPLRGKGFIQKFKFPLNLLRAIFQAKKIIKQLKPDIIISMGGYVAGPGGLAAKLCRIPLVIHEQNSIAGMTNKFLAKFASHIYTGFPDVFKNGNFVGNPVRSDIEKVPVKNLLPSEEINIFVVGGSRGAKILNDIIPEAVKLLPSEIKLNIFHQTGENGLAMYGSSSAEVSPFVNNMAEKYHWADIVICRAGALTIAEITSVGIPAILIPYPHAVDDHQTTNANYLVQHNAAVLLPQTQLTPQKLSEVLVNLITDDQKRLAMAKASRELRKEKVAEKIVDFILSSH